MVWKENGTGVIAPEETNGLFIPDITNASYNMYLSYLIDGNAVAVQIVNFNDVIAAQYSFSRIIGTTPLNTFTSQTNIDFHFTGDLNPWSTISLFISDAKFDLKTGVSWQVRDNGGGESTAPSRQIMTWKWINSADIFDINTESIAESFTFGADSGIILITSD